MAKVVKVGLPENESERKVISYLGEHLPETYVLYHNLELPGRGTLPYEYDLIVVGEYAVYTLEVKGYQGLIKGNAAEWEFESGATHKSPIPLANKKAKVIATWLQNTDLRLKKVWVQPLIVLSDDRAQVRLHDPQADRVLHLDEAVAYLINPHRLPIAPTPLGSHSQRVQTAIERHFKPQRHDQVVGDYRILETMGKNSLYTTVLAEHQMLRRRFTLKIYHMNLYASAEERGKQVEWIQRDANALHRLDYHPHIVRAHPLFVWADNQWVLPLEWIDGHSLRGLLDDRVKFDFSRKLEIVRQVGAGLNYAHSQGVMHRDVRPDNIIVPKQGPVKLVNFDCARLEGSDLATVASRVGRQLDQRYVAPEVWQKAGAVSPASDQYALGIILFELLAGRPAYERIGTVFQAQGLPSRPTEVNPSLPPEINEIIERMCAFQVASRYPTLAETLEDLELII